MAATTSAGDLISASLRWDEAWGAACSDYDLELFGPDGSLVQASRRVQDCDDDPVEGLARARDAKAAATRRAIVAAPDAPAEGGTEPHMLSLLLLGSPDRGRAVWTRSSAAGSLSQPADHPAVVISVGALAELGERSRAFSSGGPTADGRAKPDLVAPTALTNTDAAGPAFGRHVGLRSARRRCGRSARGRRCRSSRATN